MTLLVTVFACNKASAAEAALLADPSDFIFEPVIMAGAPPDSPANHVNPNVTTSPYAGVGSFYVSTTQGGFMGSGAAISPYHILTAAHLFDVNNNGGSDVNGSIIFVLNSGSTPQLFYGRKVSLNPQWTGFGNPSVNDDLAIVELTTPLPAGTPIYPISHDPFNYVETLTMVGYGRSGNGNVGYSTYADYYTKRVGMNEAAWAYADDEGSGVREVFQYDFDAPTGTGTDGYLGLGNDIESVIAPGDSGGPSFVTVNGELELWGVNTFTSKYSYQTAGTFGTWGGGMVVSAYDDWIDSIIAPVPEAAQTALLLAMSFSCLCLLRRKCVIA